MLSFWAEPSLTSDAICQLLGVINYCVCVLELSKIDYNLKYFCSIDMYRTKN